MPLFPLHSLRNGVNELEPQAGKWRTAGVTVCRANCHSERTHFFLAEKTVERPAAVKGAPKARAQRTLEGEDRSTKIPREGMATSQDLLKRERLFIMR